MSRLIPCERVKRILIIRNDAIGDTAITLPPLQSLRDAYPDAHIAVLAVGYNARVIKHLPFIDEVIIDREANDFRSFIEYVKWIKSMNFDVAVHCRAKGKTSWGCYLAGVPFNIGDKAHVGLYPVYRKYGIFFRSFDVTAHNIEFHYELLKPLGVEMPDPIPYTLFAPEENLENARQNLLANGRRPDKPLVTLQVGTGGGNRPLTSEKLAEYIKGLLAKRDVDVCISGFADKELKVMEEIQSLVETPLIHDVKSPLLDLMGIYTLSDVMVSVDTGPFHLATGLKTPQVAIFPSKKVVPTRWGPWGNRHFVVRENRGCLHDCPHQQCPYSVCSDDILASDMVEKTCRLLDGEGSRSVAEQRAYWVKVGLNIAVLYDDASEAKAKAFQKQLSDWGFYALLKSIHAPDLFQFMRENNTLLVHNLSKKKRLKLWWMSQKLAPFLHHPPLILKETYEDEMALVQAYQDGFKARFI